MLTDKSNHSIANKSCVRVSDLDILAGATKSKVFSLLFEKRKHGVALWTLFVHYFRFMRIALANIIVYPLRFGVGSHSTGLIVSGVTLMTLTFANSINVHPLSGIFAPLAAPFILLSNSPEDLYRLIFHEVRSLALLNFTVVIFALSIIHYIVGLFLVNSRSSRGRSIFGYALRLVKINIPDSVLHLFVEPILIGTLGYVFIEQGDALFGYVLWVCSLAELVTQMLDRAAMLKKSGVLNA